MKKAARGVTLFELLIVVVIVGILVAVAVPSYRNYVIRANRAEARSALLALATAEEKYYLQCNTYTASLGSGAGTCSPANLQFPAVSERGNYAIAVTAADAAGWTATATARSGEPQYDDTKCRVFGITSTGARTASTAGNVSNDSECWSK